MNELAHDPARCSTMGAAGRQRVATRNSLATLGQSLCPVYAGLWNAIKAEDRGVPQLGPRQIGV
jgi:hypothetical protein